VFVPRGLLFVGDVHAAQGDGELSGIGLETRARATATIDLRRGTGIAWPWLETAERTMVLTAGATFEAARDAAVECILAALEAQRGLAAADALMLISLAGDLRIGQAFGAPDVTVRLELPATLGLRPQ
jgi:acetamidase/formamidase